VQKEYFFAKGWTYFGDLPVVPICRRYCHYLVIVRSEADEAIHSFLTQQDGLLRFARNDGARSVAHATQSHPLPHHRSIHDVLDLLPVIFPHFAGRRRADHHDEALLGIAEELRAVGAIPGELAGIARHR